MRSRPFLFLFDIDGTLLRAGTKVHRDAFAEAFRTVYNLPLTLDGISAAGRTDTWLLMESLRQAGLPDDTIRERMPAAFACMEDYVDLHLGDLTDCVLPGVRPVLQTLEKEGWILGLLTGNLRAIAHAKMRHAGLSGYFDTGAFGDESEVRSHLVPVALQMAGEVLGGAIPPHRAAVIGDTLLDIEAGQAHGTYTVAVATGPFSVNELERGDPDIVLDSLEPTEDALTALLDLAERP